jgi:tetratricopeptide (TPR) repeat protein
LTLHEANDVDFFKIDFQGSPKAGPCEPYASKGGWIHFSFFPSTLFIQAQEEYCRPLTLDIYDSKGNENFSAVNKISLTCPSQVFTDENLFLAVKYGKEPVRYKLTVAYSNRHIDVQAILYPRGPLIDLHLPESRYYDLVKFTADSERCMSELIEYRSNIEKADLVQDLGQAACLAGLYEQAGRFFEQSLSTFQKLGFASEEAGLWRNLGELYTAQGKVQEALESLERAAQLHEKLEDSLSLVYDRISLGRSYLVLGEASRSLAVLEKALRLLVGTRDWRGRALILLCQAEACLTLNLQEDAMACLTLAENSSSRIEDSTLRQHLLDLSNWGKGRRGA